MSSSSQEFCLRWSNFHSNVVTALDSFKNSSEFVDVTIACEGKFIHVHKILLAACSVYFRDLLKNNPCTHPIVILPSEVKFSDMEKLTQYIYQGEVNVFEENLARFLKTANMLKISGLAETTQRSHINTVPTISSTQTVNDCWPKRSVGDDSLNVNPKRARLSVDTTEPPTTTQDASSSLPGAGSDSEITVKEEMVDCDLEPNKQDSVMGQQGSNHSIQLPVFPPDGQLSTSCVPPPQVKTEDGTIQQTTISKKYNPSKFPMERLDAQKYHEAHYLAIIEDGCGRRQCQVCGKSVLKEHIRRRVTTECKKCKTALCPMPCFREYHYLENF